MPHPFHLIADLGDYFTWWQGLLVLLLIGILIAYKMYKDKYQS